MSSTPTPTPSPNPLPSHGGAPASEQAAPPSRLCGTCREPIAPGSSVRHFGCFEAHQESGCIAILRARIADLEARLAAVEAKVAAYEAEPVVGYGVGLIDLDGSLRVDACYPTSPTAQPGSGSDADHAQAQALQWAREAATGDRRVVALHARELPEEVDRG